jgi:hypothetical protein
VSRTSLGHVRFWRRDDRSKPMLALNCRRCAGAGLILAEDPDSAHILESFLEDHLHDDERTRTR